MAALCLVISSASLLPQRHSFAFVVPLAAGIMSCRAILLALALLASPSMSEDAPPQQADASAASGVSLLQVPQQKVTEVSKALLQEEEVADQDEEADADQEDEDDEDEDEAGDENADEDEEDEDEEATGAALIEEDEDEDEDEEEDEEEEDEEEEEEDEEADAQKDDQTQDGAAPVSAEEKKEQTPTSA